MQEILEISKSKYTFATLEIMFSIVDEYLQIRSYLNHFFPTVATDPVKWLYLKDTCTKYLDKSADFIGSSPGATHNDIMHSVSSDQVNTESLKLLYIRLRDNVPMNTEQVNFDDRSTWTSIFGKIILAESLNSKYTMYRNIFNSIKDSSDEVIDSTTIYLEKNPEQLSAYLDCEMNLPINSQYPSLANYDAFIEVLGFNTYHAFLPTKALEWISWNITTRFRTELLIENIRDSELGTGFYYTIAEGSIGCVVKIQITPDATSIPVNLSAITYSENNKVKFDGFAPSGYNSLQFVILQLFAYDITINSDGDIVIPSETVDGNWLIEPPITQSP
jgi:hypothetical protein